ncbi:DEAD/DEAH box helicase family protein [Streptomyces sp. enrichment culture]|uniref:DEAD/DEAH box helicase family protein n=1 Tax=Streptomyces sp. enrichment culture TaxID=1795815 RepID=UPI003F56E4FC
MEGAGSRLARRRARWDRRRAHRPKPAFEKEVRPHQREAVDARPRSPELPARSTVPERGLRTQVIMVTGSGKTLVATRSAEELRAGRVPVLVPSPWICSLRPRPRGVREAVQAR